MSGSRDPLGGAPAPLRQKHSSKSKAGRLCSSSGSGSLARQSTEDAKATQFHWAWVDPKSLPWTQASEDKEARGNGGVGSARWGSAEEKH
jgi:hypothetical protein